MNSMGGWRGEGKDTAVRYTVRTLLTRLRAQGRLKYSWPPASGQGYVSHIFFHENPIRQAGSSIHNITCHLTCSCTSCCTC